MRALLGLLVRLFPARFRRQFGADIRRQVGSDYDRARARGGLAALVFSLDTGFDLARSALAERWYPTWTPTPRPSPPGERHRMVLNSWIHELRHAVRTLLRSPAFAAVTVVTLGLAIGANVGIFSVVDAVLLDPLPFVNTDRLVRVAGTAPGSDFPEEFGLAAEFFVEYREQSKLLEDIATYNDFTATLRAEDRIERIRMSAPAASMFSTLQAVPMLGRLPVPEDEDRVVVLSHALWTSWFGSDPDVIGRTYSVAGADRTVIGVMGPDFWFPNDRTLLWFPEVFRPEEITPGRFGYRVVARMAPGVSHDALVEELTTLARRLPDRFGGSANYARLIGQFRPIVRPLEEEILGGVSGPLWVLLGAMGVVLLIACANVGNLFLVRTEHRQRDLAVRRALGAGRGELIRSMMAEAAVIALLAGALAVLLAWLSVPLLLRAAPPNIPRLDHVHVGIPTLAFALGTSLLAALVCGLLPAVRASSPGLTRLRDAGGRGSTHARHWARDVLVVAQTALALVLLIGSGLLLRSFWQLRQVDPGYDVDDIFTFQIAPERNDLDSAVAYARFHMDFMDRIAAMPGVESVGVVENVPLNEGTSGGRFLTEDKSVGEGDAEQDAGTLLYYTYAGGDYFKTMGIDVLRGRPFRRADQVSDLGNVVISESAANLLWPGEDPIGKRLRNLPDDAWETVVGVVDDVKQYGFRDTPQPLVYYSLVGQGPDPRWVSSPAYVVKTPRAEDIAPEIRALVRQVAPEAPMYRVFTMARLAADSMVRLSFTTLTLGIASTLALVLGAIGLFGVLSYVVAERTREIGVRMALGAQAQRVRRMVVAQGARLLTVGVVIGLGVAVATTRVLGSLLYGVGAADVGTFVGMSVTMVLVGLLAAYMPARRASSVDPVESLRGE